MSGSKSATRWCAATMVTLFAAPSFTHSLAAQQIRVAERWSTKGSAETAVLGAIAGMAEAADGSIWVAEGLGKRFILALDARGNPQRIVARDGNGPGEVGAPTLMARRSAGGLAVYDMLHNAVELFGSNGEFEQRVMLETKIMNPKGFDVLPSGDFVLGGGVLRSEYALHRFDRRGKLVGSWHRVPRTKNPRAGIMVAGGPVAALPDGSILFSQAAPYTIVHYPPSAENGRVFASDPELLDPIGDDFIQETGSGMNSRRTFKWFFPQSRGIFRLPDGHILNVVWMRDAGRSVWDVYSPQGKRIARQVFSRAYEPWALARNGDVLASYRDPETGEHIATRLRVTIK